MMSWGFTLMGVFNIIVLCVVASFLAMRVIGPESFVVILMPTFAFMLLVFMGSEILVNVIFDASVPDPVDDRRFIEAVAKVRRKSRMWIKPRARVLFIMGKPNAMAYGPPIPGLAAVGVSRELVDMVDDNELEGIIAHEFAHIKCRDTGILIIIGLILSLIDKMRGLLRARNTTLLQSPIGFAMVWVIYAIGRVATYISRFSISQERELAADALGASYVGSPRPLISGLRKLHAWSESQPKDEEGVRLQPKPMFEDLMVSHPGLEERIASLEAIELDLETTEGVVA
jgi:heat shock protein HtpX